MPLKLAPIRYKDLNARQKESYNFQKVSAVLADFGFVTLRLSDDWQSADFIASHIDGETFLKVQLKSRLTFDRKYLGKNLYIAFPDEGTWYLYKHDPLLKIALQKTNVASSKDWQRKGLYHFPRLNKPVVRALKLYKYRIVEWKSAVASGAT